MESLGVIKNFWKNKKVLITGHTGFKGSWMSLYLYLKGAKLYGYSLPQKKKYAIFNILNLREIFVKNKFANIKNKKALLIFFKNTNPDLAIHMAAQPIVMESYKKADETYQVNVNGTINFLECLLKQKNTKAAIIITSDKCYENNGLVKKNGFTENDKLGGKDPYSSSKACAELVTEAYRYSFLNNKKINVASVRAGNVIGGGDWADYRLFVDLAKFIFMKKKIQIRNLNSIRPWQHVLEPINGYSILMEKLFKDKKFSKSWNFGPNHSDCISVKSILNLIQKKYQKVKKIGYKKNNLYEAQVLKLDISNSKKKLNWKPKTNVNTAIKLTFDWYEFLFKNLKDKKEIFKFTINQIKEFQK